MTNTFYILETLTVHNSLSDMQLKILKQLTNRTQRGRHFRVAEWVMCGGPQVHSEIKITLLIFKHTPNSKSSLRILITHSEIQNYTPVSKSSLEFENSTPNSKTSLRIRKRHFQFENITLNSQTYSEFKITTPNSKTPLRIRKHHSTLENMAKNSKTSLPILKLHSQFENFTPNSKSKTQSPRALFSAGGARGRD